MNLSWIVKVVDEAVLLSITNTCRLREIIFIPLMRNESQMRENTLHQR